ncbi:ubiquitin carboxyl-terminal hydrolase 42-like [Xenopus laevis]|uniref:Ubiquitin carboxyl-terminal hydrolase 42-like n=1 Tax=Xenopus laevis TaxID=8355 RepID=A0A8J1L4Z3_XENLA|nr:ubiquitin carboxyl-terminal hydrolase 42-like [Xenopus laevis]XP_041424629.1 ubiquitin carboxyl-terminal hydrolase 42-like [Xenopus laevis]
MFFCLAVTCLNCTEASDTYDQFMDIQLDIRMSNSINQALCQYVQPEQLGECSYRCSKCHQMVTALKTVTVHQPSNVLTLCLNRFDIFSNRKIKKSVAYPECLDLRCYTSEPNGTPILYNLYAVLVHAGTTCNSGHYFCYVKGPNGNWYKMNDNSVTSVDIKIVLKQEAYLLFYIRYVLFTLSFL